MANPFIIVMIFQSNIVIVLSLSMKIHYNTVLTGSLTLSSRDVFPGKNLETYPNDEAYDAF